MNISPELLKIFDSLKAGKVYYGDFARDGSSHAAVVISVYKGMVNYFCFTSQEQTIRRYLRNDPLAGVSLTEEESGLFFPNGGKQTFIYCGRSNWGQLLEKTFLEYLSTGKITLRAELPEELFTRIKNALRNSRTLTQSNLLEIGLG
ncbi:MAG: hypothetical protein IJR93_08025 [Treponema sp.]|nr:hypothetical protein [Treponema sp.]MBQ7166873.1 hypothetical protein [Treponema sp.]